MANKLSGITSFGTSMLVCAVVIVIGSAFSSLDRFPLLAVDGIVVGVVKSRSNCGLWVRKSSQSVGLPVRTEEAVYLPPLTEGQTLR